jgi:hypothetical protein
VTRDRRPPARVEGLQVPAAMVKQMVNYRVETYCLSGRLMKHTQRQWVALAQRGLRTLNSEQLIETG